MLKATSGHFVGRSEMVSSISEALQRNGKASDKIIVALTGMGGIGKTALALEVAFRTKDVRHVFSCYGTPGRTFAAELEILATSVGPEILAARHYPLSEWATIWRGLSQMDKIAAFNEWLQTDTNRSALFLIDDIDALSVTDNRTNLLSHKVNVILYTGRNPNAFATMPKIEKDVPELGLDELMLLMKNTIQKSSLASRLTSISDTELSAIAQSLHGHPLAACNALHFMTQTLAYIPGQSPARQFVDMFSSDDWELRKEFLAFKPYPGPSIMDNFEISMQWGTEEEPLTSRVLQIAAFLASDDLDFRDFLYIQRPWLLEFKDDVPNHGLFDLDKASLSRCVRNLRSSSSVLEVPTTSKLRIHPIWLECLRQRVGDLGRRRILRQIVLLIRVSMARREHTDLMDRFLENCRQIAHSFRISEHDLAPSSSICKQVDDMHVSTTFIDCQESILRGCRGIVAKLAQCDGFSSDELYADYLLQVKPLLHRFLELENNHAWNEASRHLHLKHVETYDVFLKIARPNAMLIHRLMQQREAYLKRWKMV